MTIRTIMAMRSDGVADGVIRSKIRAGGYAYKDFDGEELAALKKLGISDETVEAMIESTAAAVNRRKEKEERDALKAEIAELRKLVVQRQSRSDNAGDTTGGKTVQTKDGPMDVAACVAAKLLAAEACDRLPWPASSVCSGALKSGYPCGK